MHNLTSQLSRGSGPFDVVRKIRLAPCVEQNLSAAIRQLRILDGVFDAKVYRSEILCVSYDAATIGFCDIEATLGAAGITWHAGYWSHFKSMLYGYMDKNAKSARHSTGGACCNRPPSPMGKKR